jgi:hypothetical protein
MTDTTCPVVDFDGTIQHMWPIGSNQCTCGKLSRTPTQPRPRTHRADSLEKPPKRPKARR